MLIPWGRPAACNVLRSQTGYTSFTFLSGKLRTGLPVAA